MYNDQDENATIIDSILDYVRSDDCPSYRKHQLRDEWKRVGKDTFYERMKNDVGFRVWSKDLDFRAIRAEIINNRIGKK